MLELAGQRGRALSGSIFGFVLLTVRSASGDAEATTRPAAAAGEPSGWSAHGYVETYYAWNFHRPGNGLNHHRAYDFRHNTFALQNAAISVDAASERARVRISLQSGSLPRNDAKTLGPAPPLWAEPAAWQFLKEGIAGYDMGILVEGGLFEWPTGMETPAVHDDWCWSKSNLYLAMPVRVAGVRASYPSKGPWSILVGVFNGWTGAWENNEQKTFTGGVRYEIPGLVRMGARYVGGVERAPGAAEGRPVRHAVDGYVRAQATPEVGLGLEGNGGAERTVFGTTWWAGATIEVRVRLAAPLYFVARLDGIRQVSGKSDEGTAEPVLFTGPGVASGTATLELVPEEGVSMRVEYRHDQGGSSQFFRGEVLGTGTETSPYEPNSMSQHTLLAGATAWF